ncbi:MAG: bifunctional demethylmenaquinone methyltransferase/2-methoxy-6-polyprenyl-1,4-benzoquinol methylase UbiE [Proteobacteria bacterium]|nr:bifunctional demethylmenaquinone methyltransferase/2-methoxy-6-polyprenyl-1,4-benzoquinol methylase UbiE [Pseudomonadota bacterium]
MSHPKDLEHKQKEVTAMFNRVAPRYDFLNTLLSFGLHRYWRKKLISWLPNHHNSLRLLDVATGSGDVLLEARRCLTSYQEFYGVDISPAMLEQAQKKINQTKHKISRQNKVRWLQGDARSLDLPDQYFDALTISFGLRNVQGRAQALREFARVLKPGGHLLILEFFQPKGLLGSIFWLYFRVFLPVIAGLFAQKQDYAYLPHSVKNFPSEQAIGMECEQVGFVRQRKYRFFLGSCVLLAFVKGETTS